MALLSHIIDLEKRKFRQKKLNENGVAVATEQVCADSSIVRPITNNVTVRASMTWKELS